MVEQPISVFAMRGITSKFAIRKQKNNIGGIILLLKYLWRKLRVHEESSRPNLALEHRMKEHHLQYAFLSE